MNAVTGTGGGRARSAHRRALRITALLLVGALVAWLAGGWPWNNNGFLYAAPRGDFYPLWFAYAVFAVAIGDLWESIGVVACAAVVVGFSQIGYHGFDSPYYSLRLTVLGWLLFVLSSAALVALAHRRRRAADAQDKAVPLVSSDIEDPVLIIRGHAQILQQGTGVVFDTRQARGSTTAELAGVRVARGSTDGE